MKDFDFDELDRAVSDALRSRGTPKAAPERTKSLDDSSERVEEPEIAAVPRGAKEAMTPAPTPQRPRSGRVMDVMLPGAKPMSTVSRLQPSAAEPVSEKVKPSPAVRRPTVAMNDIDLVPRKKVTPAPVETSAPIDETPDEDEHEHEDGQRSIVPESPFLPDAKVEKRPLGGGMPMGAVAPVAEAPQPFNTALAQDIEALLGEGEETLLLEANPSEDGKAPEQAPEVDIAEEVKQNSLAENAPQLPITPLEPSAPNETPETLPIVTDLEAEDVPEFDVVEPQQSVESPEEEKEPARDAPEVRERQETTEFSGPVSITPQYVPKERETGQSGEIFDTESYHRPIATPPKKKGGALKIIGIVLGIIILGVGAGVAGYLYVLPLL